ncbi:hypothetical protein VJ918_05090 [Adlercreutzia sp. R21]|uniref:hypothetical protein n=1 Tax=Adlercreutzia wanghongyangiae TaxID=3111451 RepID=UPI002DC02019|nr:hypothetical protein [Adlercreutzia sp. R21]MEC4184181.1 hypothetical protein [Adlercreutzia sp. R21]
MNPQSHSAALRGPRPRFLFGGTAGTNRIARALLALGLAALLCLPACSFTPNEAESASSRNETAAEAASHLAFRTDEKLQQHFEKHGRETGCATAEEYLAAANAVIADPASLHKLQAEDGDDLYFLERTGEFVVVSPAGYIRTYYLTDRNYFDRQ